MDFTIDIYKKLILALKKEGYNFQTFAEFMKAPMDKSVILRHDVDKRPKNSALFAHIQKEFNIKGTYYFRCVPESYDEQIIRTISKMNHEINTKEMQQIDIMSSILNNLNYSKDFVSYGNS